jgi:dTDP-4-amino-4,6-dideoxygalactose transaminase
MHEMGKEEIAAVTKVLESRQFMRYRGGEGGFTETFEKQVREDLGIRHALTMNSGTSALICALIGMNVGPGDEVIVPAYTWVASAMAAVMVGAIPVIAEIDETLMLDPDDVERKITPYTKAIIPVHMINRCCDMDRLTAIAEKYNLLILEDACQAVGLSYRGRRVGTIGTAGAYSFNQFKNITCGEGGMLLTNDDKVYQRGLMMHDTGCFTRDHASAMSEPFFPGFNFRVSEIQGAILGEQWKRLDGILAALAERKKLACEILAESKKFALSPENDSESLAVTVIFRKAEDAAAFAAEHKAGRLIDSGRHVYSNWEPLQNRSYYNAAWNPHKFAKRPVEYTKDMCPKTLDILCRTCSIGFNSTTPLDTFSEKLKAMAK